jgi:hypothetical protein
VKLVWSEIQEVRELQALKEQRVKPEVKGTRVFREIQVVKE